MHNRFGFLIVFGLMASTLLSAQITITDTGEGGGKKPSPEKPLTNNEIIQMVRAGRAEASIVATIRASRKNFDLSTQGCRALNQARISRTILNAMGDGSQACNMTLDAAPGTSGNGSRGGMLTPGQSGGMLSNQQSQQPTVNGPGKLLNNQNGSPPLLGNGNKQPPAVVGTAVAAQPNLRMPGAGSAAGSPVSPAASNSTRSALNPQPLPPNSKGVPTARTILKPVKLAPPTALRKITNPRSAELNAGIIALLQQQRAAEQEASAMKLGIRSEAASRTSVVAANLSGNAAAQGLMPSRIQSSSGNASAAIKTPAAFNSVVLGCTNDPTPRIMRVSGGEAPGIFSPDAKFNLYTIAGCSFGPSAAGNAAYIFGANGFHQNLNIDFWSENGITAHLDPSLAGVLDQNNITLVVTPVGKQQLQKSGFQFYAARGMPLSDGTDQEVPLAYASVPQRNVTLAEMKDTHPDPGQAADDLKGILLPGYNQLPWNAQQQFPSFSFQGTPVAGWVFRYSYGHKDPIQSMTDCYLNDVAHHTYPCATYFADYAGGVPIAQGSSDTWDLSKLVAGFAISSYQLFYEDINSSTLCGSWDDDSGTKGSGLVGKWDFNFAGQNQITVSWPVYYCSDTEYSTRTNRQFQSSYGLAVWVLGPRCVDPWTGQKDQACMTKVKQMLS